jgi:hypothetical protein
MWHWPHRKLSRVNARQSQQKLIAEALNYIFAKHGKPKIAEQ